MSLTPDALSDARHDQMFPVLETSEIRRIARLGYADLTPAGVRIFTTGEAAAGAFVLLSGRVDMTQREAAGGPLRAPTITQIEFTAFYQVADASPHKLSPTDLAPKRWGIR